jgi:hypothetical protein
MGYEQIWIKKKEDEVLIKSRLKFGDKTMLTIICITLGALSGASSMIINYFIYSIQSGIIDPHQEFKISYFFLIAMIGVACEVFGAMLGFLLAPNIKSDRKLFILIFLIPLVLGVLGYLIIQSLSYPIVNYFLR